VSFRYCQPGEAQIQNECRIWIAGTYSFEWNSTNWESCMSHASCLGGAEVYVDHGYWRSSTNSTDMIPCLREKAWVGEYHPENEYPVRCTDGYAGILWTKCVIKDGQKYERLANFECSRCPNLIYNSLRLLGLIILVSTFFIIVIIVNVRKKRESQQSILLRILTNYLQLLTAALNFNLKFPDAITKIFYPAQRIGESSEAFMSFDWFISGTDLRAFTPSNAIFKMLLTGLLPIFLMIVVVIVWLVISLIYRRLWRDIYRNIVISIICILFLLHPMLTKVGLEIFQWVQVDKNKFRVRIDIDIECFSAEHIKWSLMLGFPIIIIWSIGWPLLAFVILYRNRKKLREPKMQKYLLILYQGLKDKAFYWELINTIRKVVMVAINVFMSTVPVIYAASTAVIVLVGLIRLQIGLQPYKLELNNKLEIDAMVTGTATLFCGVLFVSDDTGFALIILFILIAIMIMNIRFFLYWLFWMTFTLVEKHEVFRASFNLLAILLCRKNQGKDKNKKTPLTFTFYYENLLKINCGFFDINTISNYFWF